MTPIYLDYNATTPIDPLVFEAMRPFLHGEDGVFGQHFGNPSSGHRYGKIAHDAVDRARCQAAAALGARPEEIVFTGSGTEANNHAITGLVLSRLCDRSGVPGGARSGPHVITSAVEHPATLQTCDFLRRLGGEVTVLPVDGHGLVDPDDVRRAIRRETVLVTVMHANNEVGTIQPIREISRVARENGVPLHTDAAQSVGKVTVMADDLGADLLSMAGHKLYAPKGVGVLYVRTGITLEPLLHGAGHESGRRAGTENTPYLVGLGQAFALARETLTIAGERLTTLRERLWAALRDGLGEQVVLNGHPGRRLPNTLNVTFVGHVGSDVLRRTPEVAASTGSACHDGAVTHSPVLRAMGVPPELGRGAVRLSVGRFTTEDEIDRAAAALLRAAR